MFAPSTVRSGMELQRYQFLGGLHSTKVSHLLLTQQPGFDSQHSRIFFRGKIIDVAEVNQWRWLEESGQWLENVDQNQLVLARGKSVQQKDTNSSMR